MINEKEKRDKEILALFREQKLLRTELAKRVYVRLDRPYQRGWIRRYRLTKQASARPDAGDLKNILPYIDRPVWCKRYDFTRKSKKSKMMVEIHQSLKRVSRGQWERRGMLDKWKKYFHFIDHSQWEATHFYEFRHPHVYELHIMPHLVTHCRVINPDAQKRYDEINEIIEQRRYWQRFQKLRLGYSSYSKYFCRIQKRKQIERILDCEMREHLNNRQEIDIKSFWQWFDINFLLYMLRLSR